MQPDPDSYRGNLNTMSQEIEERIERTLLRNFAHYLKGLD
jgi:hypothetical protein